MIQQPASFRVARMHKVLQALDNLRGTRQDRRPQDPFFRNSLRQHPPGGCQDGQRDIPSRIEAEEAPGREFPKTI